MPLPDEHPDGDPFAAQDAARASSGWLGRLEAKAIKENAQPLTPSPGFAPPKPRSSNSTSLGKDAQGREILVVDSDSDDEEEAQMTGDENGGGSGSDDEDEDGSGTEGEGQGEGGEDGSEGEGTPAGPQDEDDDDEDDSEDDDSDDDSSSNASGPARNGEAGEDVEMGENGAPARPKSPVKAAGAGGQDGDVAMQDGEGGGDGAPKEKKKRRRRANRSPTPPLPAPAAPRPTIRLDIVLPSRKTVVDVPEYNITQMARDKGLLPPEEEKKAEEHSESEGEGDGKAPAGGAGEGENGAPPKKKRKRGPNVIVGRFGGYDATDPFVDDSEAALYEPRFYARPKREGFFVCTGEVEVAPRRGRVKGSKNKPKVDENGNPVPAAPSRRRSNKVVVVGSDGKPLHDAQPGSPAVGAAPAFGGPAAAAKPARKPGEFSPELQADIDMLKVEVDKADFSVKNKFPPHMRELLTAVAYHALELGEYDDHFFAIMPKVFPYNLFTLKKLIKREVYPKRIDSMTKQQQEHLQHLQAGINQQYGPQRAEFEARHAAWEKHVAEGGGVAPAAAGGSGAATPRRTPEPQAPGFGEASPAIKTPQIGAADAAEGSPALGKDDKDSAEPKWRFKFNEQMRYALYHATELEDQMSELTIEKQTLEKATTREKDPEKEHSLKVARKEIYKRIVDMWPKDTMTSNQISREISNYRLKLKRTGELPSTTKDE
ncbi:hypothetical protein JCM10207_007943 [Rhodosporidiobolus poonsookiae]